MSITDELRHYIITQAGSGISLACEKAIANIADCIDAEHEAMLVDARKHVYEGYVVLPKDADGEPIHVGDVVIYDHDGVRTGTPETVRWIAMGETEVHISTEHHSYTKPSTLRHYHKPTVESVLREFAGTLASAENNWGSDVDDAIAEYANKLRETVERGRESYGKDAEQGKCAESSEQESYDSLKAENAKLRKLATELWQYAYGYMPYDRALDSVLEETHKLGVEE